MEFSRQEYWRGLPFPSPGDLPGRGFIFEPPEKPPSKSNCILLSLQCDTLDLQWSVTFSFILSYSLPNFFFSFCYLVKSNHHVWFLCFQRNCFIVINFGGVVVIHSLSCILLFVTPWSAVYQALLSFIISWSLLKLMSFESVMPSNYLILCRPLLLLPLLVSQHQGLFQWVGSLHQVAKVLELPLQHQSFQWIFRVHFL